MPDGEMQDVGHRERADGLKDGWILVKAAEKGGWLDVMEGR